jgi:hypothetical protein
MVAAPLQAGMANAAQRSAGNQVLAAADSFWP